MVALLPYLAKRSLAINATVEIAWGYGIAYYWGLAINAAVGIAWGLAIEERGSIDGQTAFGLRRNIIFKPPNCSNYFKAAIV